MTELQLRLWCLWMAQKCAKLDGPPYYDDAMIVATEGASQSMRDLMWGMLSVSTAREAWELSERMP